jgi:hypothetical protein
MDPVQPPTLLRATRISARMAVETVSSMTAIRTSNRSARLHAAGQFTFLLILAVPVLQALPAAHGATPHRGTQRAASPHRSAHALHRPRFRGPRGAAAQDAARLGALVGKDCRGRADMPRNDHEWVVMCSDGKTFVVPRPPALPGAAPPAECSLAGTGPLPACFTD